MSFLTTYSGYRHFLFPKVTILLKLLPPCLCFSQVLGAAGAAIIKALSVHPCSPGHTQCTHTKTGEGVTHPGVKLLRS